MGVFIVAEVGINHNGDVCIAKKLISAAHFAGADAVKFQKRTIDVVYTQEFLNEPRISPWGQTQRDQKMALEFGQDEYEQIDAHCRSLGLPWFASAWDVGSLEFLDQFSCPYNKVASAMVTHPSFCRMVAMRQVPTFISTGMCKQSDIENVMTLFDAHGRDFTLMHTISMYPCPPAALRLQFIKYLQRYPGRKIGYSGHEVGLSPTLAAVAMGAVAVERHITLDRAMYGSDQAASVEPFGFKHLVDDIREIEAAMSKGFEERQVWDIEKEVARKLRYWEA